VNAISRNQNLTLLQLPTRPRRHAETPTSRPTKTQLTSTSNTTWPNARSSGHSWQTASQPDSALRTQIGPKRDPNQAQEGPRSRPCASTPPAPAGGLVSAHPPSDSQTQRQAPMAAHAATASRALNSRRYPHPASTHHHTAAPTAEHLLSFAPSRSLLARTSTCKTPHRLGDAPPPPARRETVGTRRPCRRSGAGGDSGRREEIGPLLFSRVWGPPEPPARGGLGQKRGYF
jgi:hypothetical protein